MKAKNLFFGALACLAFAACSNDDDAVKNPSAEGENTFVAVQLVMAGNSSSTRAWNDDEDDENNYAVGSNAELKVTDATFFFFDASGAPVQPASTYTIEKASDGSSNTVDDIYKAYIVIAGKVPAEIAAVLNMPAAAKTELANADKNTLCKALSVADSYNWAGTTSGTFVMSNSVYNDKNTGATKTYFATPVTGANIIKSAEDLSGAVGEENTAFKDVDPVVITVERVLARVNVGYSLNSDGELNYSDNTLDATHNASGEVATTNIEIKPFITGWWLHNTTKDSYLIKSLDQSYSFDLNAGKSALTEGWWNDADDKRSYWANAYNSGGHNAYRYSTANMNDKYCFENTDEENNTTLMVAAILKTKVGDKWEAINLLQWMNFNFTSEADCKAYLAKYLNSNGYSNNGSDLTADNLTLIYNHDNNKGLNDADWKTRVGLADGVTLKQGTKEITDAETELKTKIGYLKYYKGGQTYYFTKIAHELAYQETDYAIIRNHLYRVSINGIKGLGTPVPNKSDDPNPDPTPTDPTPDPDPENPEYPDPTDPTGPTDPTPDPDQPLDPETPTNDYSAISAKIQVLEYRIVKQDVSLDNK